MKEIIGAIAVVLAFVGYAPYIRHIIRGKTHPHAYSWFVWSFLTVTIFALQIQGNAGAGAYVTLAGGAVSFLVFILGLRYGKHDITISDTLFFIAALAVTAFWLVAKEPVISVTLLVAIDMLGFAPTIRKSWHKPHTETLFLYQLGIVRHSLSILALSSYTYVTLLFPVTWVLANILFSSMLIVRRKRMLLHST